MIVKENINFIRYKDPFQGLNIGLTYKITSNDLELLLYYGNLRIRQFLAVYGETENKKEKEEKFIRIQTIKKILKNYIRFGPFFDWKEEEEMIEYIQKYSRGRYVYNAYPGGDGWQLVFSKIKLPAAEKIIY